MDTEPKPSTPPIVISTANASRSKMAAINALAESNRELAKALNSLHTRVEISDNIFTGSNVSIQPENQDVQEFTNHIKPFDE